ncbi:uncharacterized protein RSE6_16008 [Rhynchosporium secalis]|uniref:Arylsulfotransferase n=1 Tax=Rhynchosporium secalis TaxID=38038 RepID=A0A1E1LXW7_RHYSE|nr:uncharacterized protein RSE6_16008 [Rhynchosporium secalis]
MDETYSVRKTLLPEHRGISLDFHGSQIFNGGKTAAVLEYFPVQVDMSSRGVRRGLGWAFDGFFKEIDFESGKALFEWHSIDHLPVSESHVRPRLEIGSGLSVGMPWDYFHINSVDKYPNGDYLISARHSDCIYKISEKDGSVIWRLGREFSSFTLHGFYFSAKHDARLRLTPTGQEQISFYNNAWGGDEGRTRNYSTAMLINIDTSSKPMLASLVKEWFPSHGGLARHQGNVQYLPNGNVFIGWGGIPQFSEFTPEGERVLDVAFTDQTLRNYRNGATEVHSWNIYGLDGPDGKENSVRIGSFEKEGYETQVVVEKHIKFGYIEAMDAGENLLAQSGTKSTFIPEAGLAQYCGNADCAVPIKRSKVYDDDTGEKPTSSRLELTIGSSVRRSFAITTIGAGLYCSCLDSAREECPMHWVCG